MDAGERAGGASDGDEKEGDRGGASFHANQHGQPGLDVLEPRPMDAGGRAGGASDGDEEEGARGGASFHADQHKQPGPYLYEARAQRRRSSFDKLVRESMFKSSRLFAPYH